MAIARAKRFVVGISNRGRRIVSSNRAHADMFSS